MHLPIVEFKESKISTNNYFRQLNSNFCFLFPQNGLTPLHIAAHYGHVDIAELLLMRSADTDARARVSSSFLIVKSCSIHCLSLHDVAFINKHCCYLFSLGTSSGSKRNWKQCLCIILGQTKSIMVFLIIG